MAQEVIAACGDSVAGKTVALLGLAFKRNTDDILKAAAIDIILALQSAGAKVRAYDPRARQVLTDVAFCQNALSLRGRLCADDRHRMDALRALDLARIKMR